MRYRFCKKILVAARNDFEIIKVDLLYSNRQPWKNGNAWTWVRGDSVGTYLFIVRSMVLFVVYSHASVKISKYSQSHGIFHLFSCYKHKFLYSRHMNLNIYLCTSMRVYILENWFESFYVFSGRIWRVKILLSKRFMPHLHLVLFFNYRVCR